MAVPTGNASWRVTTQQQTTRPDPTRGFVEGVLVSFQTGGGHSGSVFVPMAQYTVANVSAAVQAQANLLDAVGSLASGM